MSYSSHIDSALLLTEAAGLLIERNKMKITFGAVVKNPTNAYAIAKKAVFQFTIKESITKEHYKQLARLAFLFKNNSGYILPSNKADFLALVDAIEASDSALCKASHEKTLAKKISSSKNKGSLEDFIEDYCDMYGDRSEKAISDAKKEYSKT